MTFFSSSSCAVLSSRSPPPAPRYMFTCHNLVQNKDETMTNMLQSDETRTRSDLPSSTGDKENFMSGGVAFLD